MSMQFNGVTKRVRAERSALVTGVVLGVGVVGALDEAIFHQILQWHTLYWSDSEPVRLLSDGVFHLLTLALLVAGGLRLWQTASELRGHREALIAGMLIGAGGFNFYDGVVQHLVLHLHLVDEYVCANPNVNNSVATCPADVPYEVAWLALAIVLLAIGVARMRKVILRQPRHH